MSFTPLQRVALSQADDIVSKLDSKVYTIARKYKFACDQYDTPENHLLQEISTLKEIIQALRAER